MIKYQNDCCGCAVPAYPCMGESCPNRKSPHYYCDQCGEEAEKLYVYCDEEQLCIQCLLEKFAIVGGD